MKRILAILLCLMTIIGCATACSTKITNDESKMSAADEQQLKENIIGRWANMDKSLIITFDDPSAKEYTVPGYYATFITVDAHNKKEVRVPEITNFTYTINNNTLMLTSIDEDTRGETETYSVSLDTYAQTMALTNDEGITTFLLKQG